MTRLAILVLLTLAVGLAAAWWRARARRASAPAALEGIGARDGWVVFTGRYCATCRQLIERLRGSGETVLPLDIDERPDLAAAHRVTTVPTIVRLERGSVVEGAAGRRPAAELVARHLRATSAV